jgi:hypothetical protein
MQRLILSVAALALAASLAATSAVAQPGAAPSPKALALARRYVAAAQAGKILQDEAPAVAQFIISRMAPPPGGDAKASEVKHAMLDAADAAVQAKLPDFLDKTAEIYARVFSEQELEAIVGFYDSPAGKAFVAKGQTAAAPMADLIHTLGGEIQQDTEQRFCLKESDLCQKAPPPKAN